MEEVEFRCTNCGRTVERDILPTKHAILGTLPDINRTAACCSKPDYEDEEGFRRSRQEVSFRDFIPGRA
ncbi:MAG: hypothetical protein ABEJ62_00330 [Candidatus Nanohaloarchaea archaeon]